MKIRLVGLFLAVLLISTASPYVAKSSNGGNIAHAILLPVKISHDSDGETWRLPNGQNVFKAGGEAPPRIFDGGIEIDGSTLKSTRVQVDLQSINDSEIIYRNMSNAQVAKENWFVYKDGVKTGWDSVIDQNLIITNHPVSETVGAYTVTDFEKTAVKERTLINILGSLWLEYKIREGQPLKHTLNFTASVSGTYSLCQEFSDVEYDEVKKYDVDSDALDIINVDTVSSEIVDIKSPENDTKLSELEKLNQKEQLQKSLPEIVEFKKDGKHVLGEITSGAKNDFQSFEFDGMTNISKFCYGDFVLNSGESFLVDPDTFTSNNPTLDGYSGVGSQISTSCATTGHASAKTLSTITIAVQDADDNDNCNRAFLEFPISSIPNGADVTNTVFKFDVVTVISPKVVDVYSMETQPSVATNLQLWTDAADGTLLVDNTSAFGTVGDNLELDLGTSADSLVESQMVSAEWFGFGAKFDSETRDSTSAHITSLESEESVAATPKPTLEITYTPISVTLVTVNHFRGNTTALTTCNITQSNSSTSSTKACDSLGMASFSGLSGSQNYTVKDTNYNFVVNKTRNHTPTTNLIINATIVEVNCSQTGSANDIRLWYNQSNVHTMTNMTRPTCNSSNIIHWNGTFSPDGKNSMIGVTDVRIEILNATAFGKNGRVLYTNGTSQTISFSGGVITASDISVGSGTGSSRLLKNYLHLDGRPDVPTGGSASGISTSQIDLSWTAGGSGVTPITGYKIYVSSDGGINYSVLESDTGSTSTSYGHSGLTASSTRHYMVAAINTYGAGENSTSFSGTTSSASGNQGGGGGGGGGGGVIEQISNGLTLSLFPKTGTMFLGETKTFTIDFTWDIIKSSSLKIKSVVVGTSNIDSLSIVTEQLPVDGKAVVDGKSQIKVTIQAPPNQCNTANPTAQCVNLKTYTIPLSILVQGEDQVNYGPYSVVLQVEIVKQQASGTVIIVLVMAAISAAIIQLARMKKPRASPQKQHKSAFEKAIKNARKSPKNKHFLKKLFS